jgi:hypothetical protein
VAKSKTKRERKTVTLARAKTEKAEVASPTVPGKTHEVDRVVDLLASMYNRRDISQIQFAAGDRYRTAFEMLSASAGGAGDFDRVRGSGEVGGMARSYVDAAKSVSDARLRILYPRDYAVLHRVCVEGKTLEKVANELNSFDTGVKFDRQQIGYMFKSALSQLAAAWWPDKVPKIDQSTLDHLAQLSADRFLEGTAQFIEEGTPEWDRVQHYRQLQGLAPLVAKEQKIGDDQLAWGVWLRMESARMTRSISEKATVTEIEVIDRTARVAHATGQRVFWSNKQREKAR